MRPGQQNKRGRGRNNNNNNNNNNNGNNNNNNRKGSNPLTRSYDSSGPDVKIRGTAQHIAEKYAQLARDSQSSGDRVMAENYLQHAEHYNRIIASAQAQMQERFQREERQDYNDRDNNDRDDEMDGDDNNGNGNNGNHNHQASGFSGESSPKEPVFDGSGPQPVIEGTPAEVSLGEDAATQSAEQAPRRRQPRPRRQPRRTTDASASEGSQETSSGDQPSGGEKPAGRDKSKLAEVAE
jgi:hypothetical protein